VDIHREVAKFAGELSEIRRYFHIHPELSNQEFHTMETICQWLDRWGIEHTKGVADTGVTAIVRGGKQGRTVALRGDMDALPMNEQNDVPYKSQNPGVMHSCGHDAHITVTLGAAQLLNAMRGDLKGNVKFFFQPAEETTGGAERMIRAGCLEKPDVEYVLGLHVDPSLEVGKVRLCYGKMYAASDMFTLTVKGKSTHGASPQSGIDPIVIASNVVLSLQTLVSRNIAPVNPAVVTVGFFHGGTAGNVIPEQVVMNGIIRTLDNETRVFLRQRLITVVEEICSAYGGEGVVQVVEGYSPLINDDFVVDVVRKVAEETLGAENVGFFRHPSLGVEDFAYFAQARKSCFFNLGCRNEEKGYTHPLHNACFDLDEECLAVGVEVQVRSLLALLDL